MPELEREAGRLTFKLVYYGPAQGGKTTNLMRIHDLVGAEMKGELMTLETQHDRTLFFDLLPLGFRTPSGLTVRFRLFTVPGQVAHDGTRKAVLSRADGVVFVADSQRSQSVNNGESFQNLAENAVRVGLERCLVELRVALPVGADLERTELRCFVRRHRLVRHHHRIHLAHLVVGWIRARGLATARSNQQCDHQARSRHRGVR